MVLGGTKVSHKCIGPQSSQISYNFLHIKERDSISVHIRINKMTALSYLIKIGGWGRGGVPKTRNLLGSAKKFSNTF